MSTTIFRLMHLDKLATVKAANLTLVHTFKG
ncbi:hypothetical protein PQC43_gp117 [Escherichia phage vB_EcoP-101114UKE3]|uniref:Uncharacterized protein n=1 Tax=Escherichia phage vB_EcoP-101114UKE3 TaxID=2865794 RepID=A0AAE8C6J9_9CAUD|nr:hypothetical protein PQC43_gp117 [Escherichia phage vB_EcoP-101114UKE3]QZI79267.1 hypothetical protein 101114UKE3_136 [Escherichia phage vB_EcoP-101114UKE3]USM81240.1 hypothetical protein 101114BS3_113 [Escherichia phage vB_EcoP-101114BS3]